MKLSKQERIATIVILILVILGVGIFVFIKPAFETLSTSQRNLANKQAEYQADLDKASLKSDLRTQIEEAYSKGEHMADMFFPELTTYEADEAIRAFLAQCDANVLVESISVEEPTTATLSAYFYTGKEVVYDLKTYATQGTDADEAEERRAERLAQLQSALGDAQTIGASTVTFTVSAIDRDELFKFADEVNNYIVKENGTDTRKAIILNGISIEYPEVEEEYNKLIESINAEAEEVGRAALIAETGMSVDGETTASTASDSGSSSSGDEINVTDTLYEIEVSITFYSIERMEDPTDQLDRQDNLN